LVAGGLDVPRADLSGHGEPLVVVPAAAGTIAVRDDRIDRFQRRRDLLRVDAPVRRRDAQRAVAELIHHQRSLLRGCSTTGPTASRMDTARHTLSGAPLAPEIVQGGLLPRGNNRLTFQPLTLQSTSVSPPEYRDEPGCRRRDPDVLDARRQADRHEHAAADPHV